MKLVKINRCFEDSSSLTGFLVEEGKVFMNILLVSDDIEINGHLIIRSSDVTEICEEFESSQFMLDALRLKNEMPREKYKGVNSIKYFIVEAIKNQNLISIGQEEKFPDEVFIGKVVEFSEQFVLMRGIDVDAFFYEETTKIFYDNITSLEINSKYVNALAMVSQERIGNSNTQP